MNRAFSTLPVLVDARGFELNVSMAGRHSGRLGHSGMVCNVIVLLLPDHVPLGSINVDALMMTKQARGTRTKIMALAFAFAFMNGESMCSQKKRLFKIILVSSA